MCEMCLWREELVLERSSYVCGCVACVWCRFEVCVLMCTVLGVRKFCCFCLSLACVCVWIVECTCLVCCVSDLHLFVVCLNLCVCLSGCLSW